MSKRTRLFLVVSIGILVLGLGSGALASYLGLQNFVVIGGDGPAELAYVPRDARMVAFADLHDIVNSELRQKLREIQGANPDSSQKFEQATGIDPERDVDRILVFSTSAPPAANGVPAATIVGRFDTVLASGRFDTVRIEGFIRERGGSVAEYKGKRLLTDGEGKTTVAFVEAGLVAVGSPAAVKLAIDTRAAGRPTVRDNPDLMRHLKSVDSGNAWAVSRFDGLPVGTPIPADFAAQLPAISWVAISGHVDGGLRGTVRAEAGSDAAARDLRDVVRGFLALARLQAGQRPEFSAVINSLEMGGDGKTVTLDFAVPDTAIAAMASLHARRPAPSNPDALQSPTPAQPRRSSPPSVPGI